MPKRRQADAIVGVAGNRRLQPDDSDRSNDVAAATGIADLIGGREVDAAAIVGALVVVEVVLILTAELDQVVAFQLVTLSRKKLSLPSQKRVRMF